MKKHAITLCFHSFRNQLLGRTVRQSHLGRVFYQPDLSFLFMGPVDKMKNNQCRLEIIDESFFTLVTANIWLAVTNHMLVTANIWYLWFNRGALFQHVGERYIFFLVVSLEQILKTYQSSIYHLMRRISKWVPKLKTYTYMRQQGNVKKNYNDLCFYL